MGPFVDIIEEVDRCLAKKEYYEKLMAYAPQKTDEGEMKIELAKSRFLKEMNDFDLWVRIDFIDFTYLIFRNIWFN